MAEALYRKYRPQTFDDVVGQTHIERTLRNALEADRVSHAYLFCGPRGTGKTTTARLLAKALLCKNGPTPAPDGTCEECQAIAEGTHPDVYELDAASRTGVENVREEIIGRVQYAPVRGRYKVYIIDEVHMLSIAAFNALLKTLEEPPEHVVFILCTTDPQRVPETIRSRCQRFDFHRLSNDQIVARLGAVCVSEGVEFEADALELIARRAQGGMRDALTALEQLIAFGNGNVTLQVANEMLGSLDTDDMSEIVDHIARRDVASCLTWMDEYVETGADLAQFAKDLAAYIRDLYVVLATDGAVEPMTSQSSVEELAKHAEGFGVDRLAYLLDVMGDLNSELRASSNPRLSFEIALMRMARPQGDLTLDSLAARVEALEVQVASGAVAAAPATGAVPAAGASSPAGDVATSAPSASVAPSLGAYRTPERMDQASTRPATSAPATASAPVTAGAAPQRAAAPAPTKPSAASPFAAAATTSVSSVASARAAVSNTAAAPAPAPAPAVAASTSATAPATASAGHPARTSEPTSTPSAASPSGEEATEEIARKISNPAALQRGWKTALADIKRTHMAYAALLLTAHVQVSPTGAALDIEFPSDNSFAYGAARKPEVVEVVKHALNDAFGGVVPFEITQAKGPSKPRTAPSAPAPAPAPAPANPPAPRPAPAPAPAPAPQPMSATSAPAPAPRTSAPAPAPSAQAQAPAPASTASASAAAPTASASASSASAAAPEEPSWDEVPLDAYGAVEESFSDDDAGRDVDLGVHGPAPVDPDPVGRKLGFDSMPPEGSGQDMTPMPGWPMPDTASAAAGPAPSPKPAAAPATPAAASAPAHASASAASPSAPSASAPVAASAPSAAPVPAPAPSPAPTASSTDEDTAAAGGSGEEMDVADIFGQLGVSLDNVKEE
jgi:DNA polymerase-3 subunit gamma/tau